jgi:hypothetical protein
VDLDTRIKLAIYRHLADTGAAPSLAGVAESLGIEPAQAQAAAARLQESRLLVLEPGSGEVRMAPPFSAVPTGFRVRSGPVSSFANCVWDAYGIAAALHQDVDVAAACGCCGHPMTMAVRSGAPVGTEGVAHFAVPAARWWTDIVFT